MLAFLPLNSAFERSGTRSLRGSATGMSASRSHPPEKRKVYARYMRFIRIDLELLRAMGLIAHP